MVRTVKHVEDDEALDSSSPTESKRVDQKGNALRSKHSETEQRRRSKINERFQILRDLIPENDQKRDKASFLLEVIEYIQFLQEKLQMYEGSCQGWSPEPSKLTPWKVSSGPIESIIDQSHLERQFSGHEDNIIFNPSPLSNAQNSMESDLMGASLYKSSDNPPIPTTQGLPLNLGPSFEGVPDQPYQESFAEAEQLIQQSRSHLWRGRSRVNDCSVPAYTANEEELRCVNGEASSSSAYSQRLLNSISNALQSSGVDLSHSNISVQLDLGKRTSSGIAETVFNKEHENPASVNSLSPGNIDHNYEHHHKRFRADQS